LERKPWFLCGFFILELEFRDVGFAEGGKPEFCRKTLKAR